QALEESNAGVAGEGEGAGALGAAEDHQLQSIELGENTGGGDVVGTGGQSQLPLDDHLCGFAYRRARIEDHALAVLEQVGGASPDGGLRGVRDMRADLALRLEGRSQRLVQDGAAMAADDVSAARQEIEIATDRRGGDADALGERDDRVSALAAHVLQDLGAALCSNHRYRVSKKRTSDNAAQRSG